MSLFTEVLPELQQLNEENLPFTCVLSSPVQVRDPNTAEYTTTWDSEPAQPCRFGPASAGGTNIRHDQPTAAGDWLLVLKAGAAVSAGQQAAITGPDWARAVLVERVAAPRANEMLRKAYCVDLEP